MEAIDGTAVLDIKPVLCEVQQVSEVPDDGDCEQIY